MKKPLHNFLFLLFFIQPAFAQTTPATIANNLNPSFLIGETDLKTLGRKVYHIALWSEAKNFSYDKKFAIHIVYNMDIAKSDLVKKSMVEIGRLHPLSDQEKQSYSTQLEKIITPVKKGDEKVNLFIPSQGVETFYNGKPSGKISDPKLARLFVDIWLDARGSYPEVTKKILGK